MRKLLLPALGAPLLGLAIIAALVAAEFRREANGAAVALELAYAGDVKAGRQVAACYREGCRGVRKAPVLGCAWATIVVQEQGAAPDAADAAAERESCASVPAEERPILQKALSDIRERMRLHASRHPS